MLTFIIGQSVKSRPCRFTNSISTLYNIFLLFQDSKVQNGTAEFLYYSITICLCRLQKYKIFCLGCTKISSISTNNTEWMLRVEMLIDGNQKRNRYLSFELQSSRVYIERLNESNSLAYYISALVIRLEITRSVIEVESDLNKRYNSHCKVSSFLV